jgi:glycosyltransferase involved in cell wall biosynthesis
MKILQIVPGSGDTFYCENCLRDNDLIRALYRSGQDAMVVPLYLPPQLESPDADMSEIFFGGINVYLQQQFPIFRHTPRWVDRFFDHPIFLKLAARMTGMTDAHILGSTTVSMLRGEHGHQKKELHKLVAWLEKEHKPDVVLLSNALLLGLAESIREHLKCPVVCMLQDEDEFLDDLEEPYRTDAWNTLKECCRHADGFVAVSDFYLETMRERLEIPAEKIHRVYPGLDFSLYPKPKDEPASPQGGPVIGYLSRLYPEKGLDILIDAFLELRKKHPNLRLHITGGMTSADKSYVEPLKEKLAEAGARRHVKFLPNTVEREEKARFLQDLTVLCVPEKRGSAFGMYLLESWIMGIPVVQPRGGAFPEVIEKVGGGKLFEPGDATACAQALEECLSHPEETREMGRKVRAVVRDKFSIEQSCKNLVEVLEQIV